MSVQVATAHLLYTLAGHALLPIVHSSLNVPTHKWTASNSLASLHISIAVGVRRRSGAAVQRTCARARQIGGGTEARVEGGRVRMYVEGQKAVHLPEGFACLSARSMRG